MSLHQIAANVPHVDEEMGARFRARRAAARLTVKALAERAGVDRATVSALEAGKRIQVAKAGAIDKALSDYERELGIARPSQVETIKAPTASEPGVVRVRVEGVYGAKALIVEAPPENVHELEEMVDRIMRNLQQQGEDPR